MASCWFRAAECKPRLLPLLLHYFAAAGSSQAQQVLPSSGSTQQHRLQPVQVGNATQPVFRDGLFATMSAAPRLNAPAFDIVALQGEHLPPAPWEKGFTVETLGTSVVRDPASGKIRMYYTLRWAALDANGVPITHLHPTPHMFPIAMAESEDGIHFTKPLLQSKPFNSSLNGANVTASNIICNHECLNIVWVENGTYWGAAGGKTDVKIWQSADGIDWHVRTAVAIPELDGMGGLDTMQDIIYDPACECHALFTRLWYRHTKATGYTGAYRMVRRVAAHDHVQLTHC